MAKQFEVIKNTTRDVDGVTVDGKHMKFGPSGGFRIYDRGLANAMEQSVGRYGTAEVVICEVDDERPKRQGYKTHFTVPRLPWHKEEES